MYKKDFALDDLQRLICHKIKPNSYFCSLPTNCIYAELYIYIRPYIHLTL